MLLEWGLSTLGYWLDDVIEHCPRGAKQSENLTRRDELFQTGAPDGISVDEARFPLLRFFDRRLATFERIELRTTTTRIQVAILRSDLRWM